MTTDLGLKAASSATAGTPQELRGHLRWGVQAARDGADHELGSDTRAWSARHPGREGLAKGLAGTTRERLHGHGHGPRHVLRQRAACSWVATRQPRKNTSCRWKSQEWGWLSRQEVGREHLAEQSLEAKRQLIHTNGIWMEVEGIREEPGPASRKLAPRSAVQLPSFVTRPPPDVATARLSAAPPTPGTHWGLAACLPHTLRSRALTRHTALAGKELGARGCMIVY